MVCLEETTYYIYRQSKPQKKWNAELRCNKTFTFSRLHPIGASLEGASVSVCKTWASKQIEGIRELTPYLDVR